MKEKLLLLLNLYCFTLFFLVNGVNENFGLISSAVFLSLLIKYLLITTLFAGISFLVMRRPGKAFISALSATAFYFLFGSIHDSMKQWKILQPVTQYRVLIPLLLLTACLFYVALKRSKRHFLKTTGFLKYFNVILLTLSLLVFLVKFIGHEERLVDFGDSKNELLQKTKLPNSQTGDPSIFWFVFDMYPSSASLERVWHFNNPLDSILKNKGFYIINQAASNYNHTFYSLTSILDMSYLPEFSQRSPITAKDQERGWVSLYENNAIKLLENRGYLIQNYSIYDLKNHPSGGLRLVKPVPEQLIDLQTFYSRVNSDIGWNLQRNKIDSLTTLEKYRKVDSIYNCYIDTINVAIGHTARLSKPVFLLMHLLLPHKPFIYGEHGEINYHETKNDKKDFLSQLKYTNTIVKNFVDTILQNSGKKNITIILQGDHGYNFEETDPDFEKESCNIFFAVYNTQKQYDSWPPSLSGVNIFRILFNDQFGAGMPVLKDSSFLLLDRKFK